MRDKVKLLICAMFCTTLIICGIIFWPTLYRYDKTTNHKIVRINRITGYTEILYESYGWMAVEKKGKDNLMLLTDNEKTKIIRENHDPFAELGLIGLKIPLPEGSFVDVTYKNDFSFRSYIYNGSEYTINKMLIVLDAKNNDGTTRWKRKYKVNIVDAYIDALSSGSISVEPSDVHGVEYYIWCIDEIYGYKNK
jgi:hypothetical protein